MVTVAVIGFDRVYVSLSVSVMHKTVVCDFVVLVSIWKLSRACWLTCPLPLCHCVRTGSSVRTISAHVLQQYMEHDPELYSLCVAQWDAHQA
jgi:hypothetical protein